MVNTSPPNAVAAHVCVFGWKYGHSANVVSSV